MIKDQCDNCRKKGTDSCNLNIVYDGHSCEIYLKRIDLEKHNEVSPDISCKREKDNVERTTTETIVLDETPITERYLKENTSISGWLSFFLFSITLGGLISVVVPIARYQTTLAEYGNPYLVWCDLSLGIMLFALAIYTLVAFCNRKPNAVFLAKTYVCTAFLTNLIVLFSGDYEETGLGSLSRIIRSLIWGVIWFSYLCNSSKVEEVIPKEYRRRTAKDYYIIAALIIIPIFFLAVGIGNLISSNNKAEQDFIQSTTLSYDEHTDGRIVFKCPEGFSCNKQEVGGSNLILFQLENDTYGNITICSDYDSDQTQRNFNSYWNNWEDDEAKKLPSSVEINERRYVNSHSYFYKVVKYETNEADVYWRYVMLFDNASKKVCVVSAYDGGYDYYLQEILESIRFQ